MLVLRNRRLLRWWLAAATVWAIAGCSMNQAVPAATSTAITSSVGGQPLPRLVVLAQAKEFVRIGRAGQALVTVQPLVKDAKVSLSIEEVWARIKGADEYLANGSVAYLGLYTDEGSKATNASYVTVGGPLSIPRCAGGTPIPEPRASTTPGGPPVGSGATPCYRIFVFDAATGDVTAMFGADYPE
jgi:hypothetical protein